jgi:hypothetical protein
LLARVDEHIARMTKAQPEKPLALDIHTVRSLSGTELAGRVAGGSMGLACSVTCVTACGIRCRGGSGEQNLI